MKNTQTLGVALLIGSIAFSGASIAGEASAEALSYTCAGCHGTNGASGGPAMPSIAGMSLAYIVESMKDFKSGERVSTIMTRIAKGYDEDDFTKMGKFFSAQNRHSANQSVGSMAKKGAKLHKDNCEKCHTEQGTVAEDDSGFLAGQWTPYLRYTLVDALDGSHDMGKKMMKKLNKVHEKGGDQDIQALLDYYASLK
ncbi:MAG: cytochrome c [Gammaproteobacteria bacterium]|nr:cytochrome c [Gammaproteobacteria bacterium]